MSNRKKKEDIIRWSLIALIVLILLMRVAPVFRFALGLMLILAILAAAGALVWYVFVKRRRDRRYAASIEGQIESRIKACEHEIAKHHSQVEEIEDNISDLQDQLRQTADIAPHNQEDSDMLLKAFRAQLELRHSKIEFYEACINKLEVLLHNQRLSQSLEGKKQLLERLRKSNYRDQARMEALRAEVEMEELYLQEIDRLSLRIQDSTTVDDAEILQAELQKMTQQLG